MTLRELAFNGMRFSFVVVTNLVFSLNSFPFQFFVLNSKTDTMQRGLTGGHRYS